MAEQNLQSAHVNEKECLKVQEPVNKSVFLTVSPPEKNGKATNRKNKFFGHVQTTEHDDVLGSLDLQGNVNPSSNKLPDQNHQPKTESEQSTKKHLPVPRLRKQTSIHFDQQLLNRFHDAGNEGLNYEHFFEAGMKTDECAAFALHQTANRANNNQHTNTADLALKTRVSQLLYDNEELNQKVNQINRKNKVLAVERERLLTTIQNTSAVLQSTFSSLSQEKDLDKIGVHRYQLEEGKLKNRSNDLKSSNSDSLERSTRYTIREFDNLLNALQGRKNKTDRHRRPEQFFDYTNYNQPGNVNVSQYDIIVKWLNKTKRSDEESSNDADVQSSSSSDESLQEEAKENVLVPTPIHSTSDEVIVEDSIKKKEDASKLEKISICAMSTGTPKRAEPLSVPVDIANEVSATNQFTPVDQNELLSTCLKNVELDYKSVQGHEEKIANSILIDIGTPERSSSVPGLDGTGINNVDVQQRSMCIFNNVDAKETTSTNQSITTLPDVPVESNTNEPQSQSERLQSPSCFQKHGVLSVTDDKKEFLQDWLEDLRTRTRLYKKSQCNSVSNLHFPDTKINDNEHEEFISLCKTMMSRMGSMISKTTRCGTNHGPFSTQSGLDQSINTLRKNKNFVSKTCPKRGTKTLSRCIQKAFFPEEDTSSSIDDPGTSSNSSSNFSLTDLANAESGKTNYKTFQKCLASLEEMNMRRTNNALTQTLIIKVLRRLISGQYEHHLPDRAAKSTTFAEDEQSHRKRTHVLSVREKNTGSTLHHKSPTKSENMKSPKIQEREDAQHKEKTEDMFRVITNVSKSIIYQDLCGGNDFTNSTSDFQILQTSSVKRRMSTCTRKYQKPNATKILLQLRQLQMEERESIPFCWLCIVIIVMFFHFGVFRFVKYFIALVFKI